MKVADILRKAKARIDTPEKWGKNWLRNHKNQCCALGALIEANTGKPSPCRFEAVEKAGMDIRKMCGFRELAVAMSGPVADLDNESSVFCYNDTHPHSDVMAKFDEAISLAEREGSECPTI